MKGEDGLPPADVMRSSIRVAFDAIVSLSDRLLIDPVLSVRVLIKTSTLYGVQVMIKVSRMADSVFAAFFSAFGWEIADWMTGRLIVDWTRVRADAVGAAAGGAVVVVAAVPALDVRVLGHVLLPADPVRDRQTSLMTADSKNCLIE